MRIPLADLTAQLRNLRSEIDAAINGVLSSGRFLKGPELAAFEQAFAETTGSAFAVGVSNGTDAITLALCALGVGPGDEVVLPANTFRATAEAVCMCGAKPVLADVDENTLMLDIGQIGDVVTSHTGAVIPVHLYGYPAPVDRITDEAERWQLHVVEDAAQAHGAKLFGIHVGTYGQAGTFSFYPGKTLGAYGDAGAVVTHNADVAAAVRRLGDHGRGEGEAKPGRNSRLDEIQAAILRVKLKHLDDWLRRRREIEQMLRDHLTGVGGLRFLETIDGAEPAPLNAVIRTARRDQLQAYLGEKGIESKPHYSTPIHLLPEYAHLGYRKGDFPVVEQAAVEVLSLPNFPEMTDMQIEYVIDAVREFFGTKKG